MAVIQTSPLENRIKNDTFRSVEFIIDVDGTPVDLTGVTIQIQFRFRCKTGSVVKDIATTSGITITDAVNGTFEIDEFTPVDWAVDTYYYDAQITFTDGSIKTYIQGTVKILQDTTDG